MYYLYKIEPPFTVYNSIEINENLSIRIIKPKINNLHSIFWAILSFGKIKEYQVIDQHNLVLSSAIVMPKIFYLTFMDKNSIHIGPCYTINKYRGLGFYPYLLMNIMNDNLDKKIFIFTEDFNISSQKGIEKAGFKKFANGCKTKFHFYKVKK